MEKVVSLAPLPAVIFIELFKMHGIEVEVVDASTFDEDRIIAVVRDAHYIIGDYSHRKHLTRAIAQAARKVKLIQQPSVGYETIDVDACTEFDLKVANTAGANTVSVAEHTILLGLGLIKNIFYAVRATASGEWPQLDVHPVELSGRTWGFVGLGRIGRAVAERLIPFGLHMIYHDPYRLGAEEERRLQVTYAALEDILKQADILSLHCPLTRETKGLIGREHIALMKPGAIIVNVARGEVIDEEALAEALRDGRLGGAALDVLSVEPIEPTNPLMAVAGDKVIFTPHTAGACPEAHGRIINMTIDNLVRVMRGQTPDNLVN